MGQDCTRCCWERRGMEVGVLPIITRKTSLLTVVPTNCPKCLQLANILAHGPSCHPAFYGYIPISIFFDIPRFSLGSSSRSPHTAAPLYFKARRSMLRRIRTQRTDRVEVYWRAWRACSWYRGVDQEVHQCTKCGWKIMCYNTGGHSHYNDLLTYFRTKGRWRSWLSHLSNIGAQKVLSSNLGRLIHFVLSDHSCTIDSCNVHRNPKM